MGEWWDKEEEQRGRRPLHFLRPRRAAEKALGAYPVWNIDESGVKMLKSSDQDRNPLCHKLAHCVPGT